MDQELFHPVTLVTANWTGDVRVLDCYRYGFDRGDWGGNFLTARVSVSYVFPEPIQRLIDATLHFEGLVSRGNILDVRTAGTGTAEILFVGIATPSDYSHQTCSLKIERQLFEAKVLDYNIQTVRPGEHCVTLVVTTPHLLCLGEKVAIHGLLEWKTREYTSEAVVFNVIPSGDQNLITLCGPLVEVPLPPEELTFISRGVGLDSTPGCFVCGTAAPNCEVNSHCPNMRHNIAAFVTREEGEIIVGWFGKGAWLDCRPGRIQLKVGACTEHLSRLKMLDAATNRRNSISQAMIAEAVSPPIANVLEALQKTVKRVVDQIKRWLETDYLAYHVLLDADSIPEGLREVDTLLASAEELGLDPNLKSADAANPSHKAPTSVRMLIADIEGLIPAGGNPYWFHHSLHRLIALIRHQRLNVDADIARWQELECGCGERKQFVCKNQFGHLDSVDCTICGAHFWHHGSWMRRLVDGWQVVWDCRPRIDEVLQGDAQMPEGVE